MTPQRLKPGSCCYSEDLLAMTLKVGHAVGCGHAWLGKHRIRQHQRCLLPLFGQIFEAVFTGRMHPADAVLGWIAEDGTHHLESYHIVVSSECLKSHPTRNVALKEDDIKPETSNSSLFEVHSISRSDNWLNIRFSKFTDTGIVPVNLAENNFINYATGKENSLTLHDRHQPSDRF